MDAPAVDQGLGTGYDPHECVRGLQPAVRHRMPVQNKSQIRDSGIQEWESSTHFFEKQSH